MNAINKISIVLVMSLFGAHGAFAKPVAAITKPKLVELSFMSKVNSREVIDIGKPGSSMGDIVVGNGDVLNLSGTIIGAVEYLGTVTHIKQESEFRWLHSEYYFGDGTDSIIIEGAEEFQTPSGLPVANRPQIFAVTGGTGIYYGANGECSAKRTDAMNFVTTCQFSVLKSPY